MEATHYALHLVDVQDWIPVHIKPVTLVILMESLDAHVFNPPVKDIFTYSFELRACGRRLHEVVVLILSEVFLLKLTSPSIVAQIACQRDLVILGRQLL